MTYKRIWDRTAEVIELMADGRPRGCNELAKHFACGRNTMRNVIIASLGTQFYVYKPASVNQYWEETLYGLIATEDDIPAQLRESFEQDVPRKRVEACELISKTMYEMAQAGFIFRSENDLD